MRRIIASLDIGTSSMKLVVGEMLRGKLNVLACIEEYSQGIKKGYIVNMESAELILKSLFKKTEDLIGLPVNQVLVTVPAYNLDCFMTSGDVIIKSDDKIITHQDIIRAMQASIYNKIEPNRELVSILPTKFIINDEQVVTSPINMVANKLTVNAVAVIIPKKNSENITKILQKLGIKVTDICISPLADYYEFKNEENSHSVGAIVNIGQSNTVVSIFNKGILTSSEIIDIGSNAIDSDLAYVFKVSKVDASYMKERFANADIHLAQPSEVYMTKDINGENIKVSEYDISAVVISRINEIFNLVKKQINLLTKKKISYIIITGGLSELKGLETCLEQIFGNIVTVGNVEQIGARHNKYSVSLGMIKYYNSRLKIRNVDYSIFTIEQQEELGGTHKRVNISDNSLLGKIYNYFFDN